MDEETSTLRDRYHAAITDFFEEVTRDCVFTADTALHAAALEAQSAVGKVEVRLTELQNAKSPPDKQVLSGEVQKTEAALDRAVVAFLRNCADTDKVDAETAAMGLRLLVAIPAAVSKEHDLSSVKASFDRIVLKQKKSAAGVIKPKA